MESRASETRIEMVIIFGWPLETDLFRGVYQCESFWTSTDSLICYSILYIKHCADLYLGILRFLIETKIFIQWQFIGTFPYTADTFNPIICLLLTFICYYHISMVTSNFRCWNAIKHQFQLLKDQDFVSRPSIKYVINPTSWVGVTCQVSRA